MDKKPDNAIFAISFDYQKDMINSHCWGKKCGHGVVGAIDLGVGTAIGCNQASCPFVEKEMNEPCGEVHGRPVYLRKISATKTEEKDA